MKWNEKYLEVMSVVEDNPKLRQGLYSLSENTKEFISKYNKYISQGISKTESAKRMNVTRQYINQLNFKYPNFIADKPSKLIELKCRKCLLPFKCKRYKKRVFCSKLCIKNNSDDLKKICRKCGVNKESSIGWCTSCKTERCKKYRNTKSGKENFYKAVRKSILKYTYKQEARIKLHNAIKNGIIFRPNRCVQCSKRCKPDGHHEDYTKPLEVKWLCRQCHSNIHKSQK